MQGGEAYLHADTTSEGKYNTQGKAWPCNALFHSRFRCDDEESKKAWLCLDGLEGNVGWQRCRILLLFERVKGWDRSVAFTQFMWSLRVGGGNIIFLNSKKKIKNPLFVP